MSDRTREEFETWARGIGYSVTRAPHGPYVWAGTANAWEGWQPAYEAGLAANAEEVKRLREDAERYRRLAWLVEFGEWAVCHMETIDRFGKTKDTYMDDKADMDAWLDRPDIVADADSCRRVLTADAARGALQGDK